MTTWSKDELRKIAEADDLHILPFREDGVTYGTPTWIWSVAVNGALYVRGYNGQASRWYQAALRQKAGRIIAAGVTKEVTFEPVHGPINDLIDDAYQAKYRGNSYLSPMTGERARAATVKIIPTNQEANMNTRKLLILGASVLASSVPGLAVADEMPGQYMQIAEIEIDPARLESYQAAVTEQIQTAMRVEPGVLVLYALSEKDNPTHIRVFEIYQDLDAYRSHLESAHFKKYKAATEQMVKSLKLVQTTPIMLGMNADASK